MQVLILGAGIAGLSLGYFLLKRRPDWEIILLEASERAGGLIRSEVKEGTLLERGPRGIRTRSHSLFELINDLKLDEEVVWSAPNAKKRFFLENNRLINVPWQLLKNHPWQLIRALLQDLTSPPSSTEDESVANFFNRRIGPFWTEHLIEPALKGIWAGDVDTLSMPALFPKLWKSKRLLAYLLQSRHSSFNAPQAYALRIKESPLLTFKNGLETLPKKIASALGARVHYNEPVEKIEQGRVITPSAHYTPDILCSTLPPTALAPFFKSPPALQSCSLSLLAMRFSPQTALPKGFGYLIARREKEPILGATFDSEIFPENFPDAPLMTVMAYPQKGIEQVARTAIERHLQISPQSIDLFEAPNAIPQYHVGYLAQVKTFKKNFPNICWLGTGFGMLAIDRIISQSDEIAKRMDESPFIFYNKRR